MHRGDLIEAEKHIEKTGCTVLGAVLNNVPMHVYNSRKYKGIYGKYRKMYTPDSRPRKDDDTEK